MLRNKSLNPVFFLAIFCLALSVLAHPHFEDEVCQVSYITVPGPTVTVFQKHTSHVTTITVLETTTRTIHPTHLSKPMVNPFPKLAEPKEMSFDGSLFSTVPQQPHFKPVGAPFSTAKVRELTTFDVGLFSTVPASHGIKHVTSNPSTSTEYLTYYTTVVITVVPYPEVPTSALESSTKVASTSRELTTTTIFRTSFVTIRRTSTILVPSATSEAAKHVLVSSENSPSSLGSIVINPVPASNALHTTTVVISAPPYSTPDFSSVLPTSSSLAIFSLETSLVSSTPTRTRTMAPSIGTTTSSLPVFSVDSSALTFSPVQSTLTSVAYLTTQSSSPQHSGPTPTYATSSPPSTTGAGEPAGCGEYGNFTLNWDDEPALAIGPQTTPYKAIFNPYYQLFFSNGYEYTSNSLSPFSPVSPSNMALFMPNDTQDIGSPYAAGNKPGEIGNGPRASLNAFWFNVYGTYLGCEDGGSEGCVMDIRGYKWDAATLHETLAAQHVQRLPACPGLVDCQMTYIELDDTFKALTGLQIWATANGATPRAFFMDNLDMGWYNNSCAAGLYRITVRK